MLPIKNYKFKDPNWRPKVLVTHSDVPQAGIKLLQEKCDVTIIDPTSQQDLLEKVKGFDAIYWGTHNNLNAELLDAAGPQLKCISTMSVALITLTWQK